MAWFSYTYSMHISFIYLQWKRMPATYSTSTGSFGLAFSSSYLQITELGKEHIIQK